MVFEISKDCTAIVAKMMRGTRKMMPWVHRDIGVDVTHPFHVTSLSRPDIVDSSAAKALVVDL